MYITDCFAYANIQAAARLADGVVYFSVNDLRGDNALNMTLNPMQAKEMGEFLTASAMQVIIPKDKTYYDASLETVLDDAQKYETEVEEAGTESVAEVNDTTSECPKPPLAAMNLVTPVNVANVKDAEKASA